MHVILMYQLADIVGVAPQLYTKQKQKEISAKKL
jgi:hypothetical protein